MNNPENLPVHAGGSLLSYSTPEEYAAALKAQHALMLIVEEHNEGMRNATSEEEDHDGEDHDGDRFDQFLYGQDFYIEPEVWELPESWFEAGGILGPIDMRDL